MSSSIPLNSFVPVINNGGLFGTRSLRNINQRRHKRQRNVNRVYQRCVQKINNEDTLNRIENLPTQITNDTLINEFFNGSSFI